MHTHNREEVARRGEEIYAARLRPLLEGTHDGEVVIINVDTGDYEIGPDSLTANRRALAKYPGAPLYGIRVGSPFVEQFSGPAPGSQ